MKRINISKILTTFICRSQILPITLFDVNTDFSIKHFIFYSELQIMYLCVNSPWAISFDLYMGNWWLCLEVTVNISNVPYSWECFIMFLSYMEGDIYMHNYQLKFRILIWRYFKSILKNVTRWMSKILKTKLG